VFPPPLPFSFIWFERIYLASLTNITLYGNQGYFCPAGIDGPIRCPSGYYCPSLSADKVPCPGGSYCPRLSYIYYSCPEGYYCPPISGSPIKCSAGYLCAAGISAQVPCPAGSFCPTYKEVNKTSVSKQSVFCFRVTINLCESVLYLVWGLCPSFMGLIAIFILVFLKPAHKLTQNSQHFSARKIPSEAQWAVSPSPTAPLVQRTTSVRLPAWPTRLAALEAPLATRQAFPSGLTVQYPTTAPRAHR
jgi:hypothetical protein